MGALRQWLQLCASVIKDEYRVCQRFLPRTTNGAYSALTSATYYNRGRGLVLTRTGTGTATLAVLNNPLAPGGANLTPQFLTGVTCKVVISDTGGTLWVAQVQGYTVVAGVLTFTLLFAVANTAVATDPSASTAEIWCEVQGSSNTEA